MPDVRLHRADRAVADPVRGLPEGLGERTDLDGVTERGTGAMGLHIGDTVGGDTRQLVHLGDQFRLSLRARRGVSALVRSVVVDGAGPDDREDSVAILQGVLQPAQHHEAHAVGEHRPPCVGREGTAAGVGRGDPALRIAVADVIGVDGGTTGEDRVRLVVQKGAAGVVHGRQARRAGAVHREGRPGETEPVCDLGRGVAAVVAHQDPMKAERLDHLGVRQEILQQVVRDVDAEVHPDPAGWSGRVQTRVLQCVHRGLQQKTLLGVGDRGLRGSHAEVIRVEERRIGEALAYGDVRAVLSSFEPARPLQLVPRDDLTGIDAVPQNVPKLLGRVGAGEATSQPGHSDGLHVVVEPVSGIAHGANPIR